ncbi:hypothetical protein D3C86_453480 [compost metagenome]
MVKSLRATVLLATVAVSTRSCTPTSEASDVLIVMLAYRFIHDGSMRRTHCGSTIMRKICVRRKARDCAASHWALGIDWIAPRKISATLALAGSPRPMTTLIQSGNGRFHEPRFSSNGNT